MIRIILLMIIGSCWASFCCTMTWRYLLDTHHHSGARWSVCDHCGHRLNAWQLIPIFGFIIQQGHCRYCGTKIDYWWPLCEVIMGTLWSISANQSSITIFLTICVSSACLIISTQDHFDHRFQPAWLFSWPLMLMNCHWPRNLLLDFILIAILTAGYFCRRIGHGDLDAMIMLTIVLGSYHSSIIILFAYLLILLYPPLYHRQPIAFIPFLSLALLSFLVFSTFSRLLC